MASTPDNDGTETARPRRSLWVGVLAVLIVLAAVGIYLLVRGGEDTTVTPGATATPTPTTTSSESPTSTSTSTGTPSPDGTITVPVYYATEVGTDLRLAREFRVLPDLGGPAETAITAMLEGEPLDPDYQGLWNPEARLLGTRGSGGVIEVDLSDEARTANLGSAGAALAVQQLVYTATAALQSDDPVRILIEGKPVEELFGAVSVADPQRRAVEESVRLMVQINDPAEGATVGRTFTVSGEASAFEANVPWRLERVDGSEVQSGFTMTTEGQTFAPFSFEVTAEPGEYVIVVEEDDPSGGEGRPVGQDTKQITVR